MVFNADQVDGFTIPELPELPDTERIERAEVFFRNTGARIVEKGGRACYDSQADEIHMPPFALFKKADYFYSVLGHETVHLTGHPSRCNRQLGNRFGSESYAAEELIAELGSAFLSAELQLETEPQTENAPYVSSWLRVLKNDKRAVFTAAGKAQQAVDWLLSRQSGSKPRKRRPPEARYSPLVLPNDVNCFSWPNVGVRWRGTPHTIEVLARSTFHAASLFNGQARAKLAGRNLPIPTGDTVFKVRPIGERKINRVLRKRVEQWANEQARTLNEAIYERRDRRNSRSGRG